MGKWQKLVTPAQQFGRCSNNLCGRVKSVVCSFRWPVGASVCWGEGIVCGRGKLSPFLMNFDLLSSLSLPKKLLI